MWQRKRLTDHPTNRKDFCGDSDTNATAIGAARRGESRRGSDSGRARFVDHHGRARSDDRRPALHQPAHHPDRGIASPGNLRRQDHLPLRRNQGLRRQPQGHTQGIRPVQSTRRQRDHRDRRRPRCQLQAERHLELGQTTRADVLHRQGKEADTVVSRGLREADRELHPAGHRAQGAVRPAAAEIPALTRDAVLPGLRGGPVPLPQAGDLQLVAEHSRAALRRVRTSCDAALRSVHAPAGDASAELFRAQPPRFRSWLRRLVLV